MSVLAEIKEQNERTVVLDDIPDHVEILQETLADGAGLFVPPNALRLKHLAAVNTGTLVR